MVTQSTDRKMEIIDAIKGTKLRLIYSFDFPTLNFSVHTTDPKVKYEMMNILNRDLFLAN